MGELFVSPAYQVRRVPIEKIRANSYNPNTVSYTHLAMVETVGVRLGETFPSAEGQSIDDLMAKTKSEAKEKYNKPSKFKAVLNTISKIFVPLIPAFVLSLIHI